MAQTPPTVPDTVCPGWCELRRAPAHGFRGCDGEELPHRRHVARVELDGHFIKITQEEHVDRPGGPVRVLPVRCDVYTESGSAHLTRDILNELATTLVAVARTLTDVKAPQLREVSE